MLLVFVEDKNYNKLNWHRMISVQIVPLKSKLLPIGMSSFLTKFLPPEKNLLQFPYKNDMKKFIDSSEEAF